MKKALVLTLCLGLLSAPAAFAQQNTSLVKEIRLSPQQIKKLEKQTKQREQQQGESMKLAWTSCSMQDRADQAAVHGLITLFTHAQENALTKSDRTLQKKLLHFYQTFNSKDKNLELTSRELSELYALCQRNQDKISVGVSEKSVPGLGFTLLITQLPANVNLVKLVFLNPDYKTQLKNAVELSPCAETK